MIENAFQKVERKANGQIDKRTYTHTIYKCIYISTIAATGPDSSYGLLFKQHENSFTQN